ncbi:MAG: DinB family protein, partial [Bacteroidota bacterium]
MQFSIQDTINFLARTPSTLDAMLRGLPKDMLMQNEGPNTWSAYDVLGHLIHGEKTDWIPRMRIILSDLEDKT